MVLLVDEIARRKMAGEFVRRHPQLSMASLRFSNVRDAGRACVQAIEMKFTGHEARSAVTNRWSPQRVKGVIGLEPKFSWRQNQ